MMRKPAPAACGIAAILVAIVVAIAPFAIRRYAEFKVDQSFATIREVSTSVVDRGAVTVDVLSWTVHVGDIAIVSPGAASRTTIASLTIVRPSDADGELTADKVTFDGVKVVSGDDVTVIPRIELLGYHGPTQGLLATPGIGTQARSQADIIARVSIDRATIPTIETRSAAGTSRTITGGSVERMTAGVAELSSVSAIRIEGPAPGPGPAASAFRMDVSNVFSEGVNLPMLWRVFASDGVGSREPLVRKASTSAVALSSGLRNGARVSFKAESTAVVDVRLRPLAQPVENIARAIARARGDEPLTPAEVREIVLMLTDGSRALSFAEIGATGASAGLDLPAGGTIEAAFGALKIAGYAEARLESVAVEDAAIRGSDGLSARLRSANARHFDATGFAAYLDRVGRNEILLTTDFDVRDVVRVVPRLKEIDVAGVDFAGLSGAFRLESGDVAIDAPLDAAPQHVAMKLTGLDAAPAAGTWIADWFRLASVDRLRGSATVALTLDPETRKLSLDELDYRFEQFGAVRAQGALAKVDPTIAVSSGATLIDKFSSVVLLPFKITAINAGAVETLLRGAADAAGLSPELFREQTARDAESMVQRLFGPPAARSGTAVAEFIRDPRQIEVTIDPKTPDVTLVDFLRSLNLGPAGIAQTIDVSIANRR